MSINVILLFLIRIFFVQKYIAIDLLMDPLCWLFILVFICGGRPAFVNAPFLAKAIKGIVPEEWSRAAALIAWARAYAGHKQQHSTKNSENNNNDIDEVRVTGSCWGQPNIMTHINNKSRSTLELVELSVIECRAQRGFISSYLAFVK